MITVIITTRNRPAYLRVALESVRQQTARQLIAQVIVSENSANTDSKGVCDDFPQLPIDYVHHDPPVSSLLHLKAIWHRIKSPIVAILHDDDWWTPEHLQDAFNVLNSQPEFAATFSNFFDTWGPTVVPFTSEKTWRAWVSSGANFDTSLLVLDPVSVLLACLLDSTFHYSTMVSRIAPMEDAYSKIVASGNEWDNERTFPVFLSGHGRIGYLTKQHAYIRNHPGQEGSDAQFMAKGLNSMRVQTTRWLLKNEPEKVALAAKKFNETAKNLRPDFLWLISTQISEPQRLALIQECGLKLEVHPLQQPTKRSARWFIKQCCPPAVLAVRRRLKKLTGLK